MMKPLYLSGADTTVSLDGPALRVCVPQSADRWFPVNRLLQVISTDTVTWETAALLACAADGVTVSFVDGEGDLVARCIGRLNETDSVRSLLELHCARPEWELWYRQWLAAMENMAIRSVLRRSGFATADRLDAKSVRQAFRYGAQTMDAVFAYERIGREVRSLLHAVVTQWLVDSGIDPARFATRRFDLADDLTDLLFWDYQLARLRWLENRLADRSTVEAPDRAAIVEFFERRRGRLDRLLRGLLGRFHRWLLELN